VLATALGAWGAGKLGEVAADAMKPHTPTAPQKAKSNDLTRAETPVREREREFETGQLPTPSVPNMAVIKHQNTAVLS